MNTIWNGKMPYMAVTVEIDKAGRLVIPKKMRESLHVRAGDRLSITQDGETLTLRPERTIPELILVNGLLVHDAGPGSENISVLDAIQQDREDRILFLTGQGAPR